MIGDLIELISNGRLLKLSFEGEKQPNDLTFI